MCSFRSAVHYMSGMVHCSEKSKISRPSKKRRRIRKMKFFDLYRRGPSSEVRHKMRLVARTTPESALCSARCGLPQLQWQYEQRWLQRQLLVVYTQWFRQSVEPQLQFEQREHEFQQPVQRQLRPARSRLY